MYVYTQGFQWKPVTSGLPPPVEPLTAICLDFINENKNDINLKKAYSTTTTTTEIFKCYKNRMLFGAQNAGNCISELLDFNLFWPLFGSWEKCFWNIWCILWLNWQSSAFNNIFRIKKVKIVSLVGICVLRVLVGGGSIVLTCKMRLKKFCTELWHFIVLVHKWWSATS